MLGIVGFLTDGRVRTNHGALAALDADLRIPDRDLQGDITLLVLRGPGLEGAVDGQRTHRYIIALFDDDLADHVADILRGVSRYYRRHLPGAGHHTRDRNLVEVRQGGVDRFIVLLHHGIALGAVGLFDCLFDILDRLFLGQDTGDGKETGLHDGVDAHTHAGLLGHFIGVNDVEIHLFVDDFFLIDPRQRIPDLIVAAQGVQQKGPARRRLLEQIKALGDELLVAAHELGLVDQIDRLDRPRTETQVRRRHRARLFRVVDKVTLGIVFGLFTDDLDRVLVGADGAIGAEAVKEGAEDVVGLDRKNGIKIEAGFGDIVVDADGKVVLGGRLFHLVKDRFDHGRSELLRRESVAAADHLRQLCKGQGAGRKGLRQGGDHIHVEGFAACTGFLGAVEHCDLLHTLGQGLEEMLAGERTEKMYLDEADFLALLVEIFDGLFRGLRCRTHNDHHALGIRSACIVEEMILPADHLGESFHRFLDNGRHSIVKGVTGFAALEKEIRVLGGAAQHRTLRREAAQPVGHHQIIVDQGAHIVLIQRFDLLHLVGGAETVKKVDEGNPRLKGGCLCDQRKVMGFLHRVGSDQPPAGGAHRHNVAVVAKDREGMRGHSSGRNMEHRGGQLAGNLEHVRDH